MRDGFPQVVGEKLAYAPTAREERAPNSLRLRECQRALHRRERRVVATGSPQRDGTQELALDRDGWIRRVAGLGQLRQRAVGIPGCEQQPRTRGMEPRWRRLLGDRRV